MENPITFKPVFWRLFIYKFFPFYIGWVSTNVVYGLKNNLPDTPLFLIFSTIAIFLTTLIIVFFTQNNFEIVIDKANISGMSPGWGGSAETFSIIELDSSYRNKTSFYEKISFFRNIHSLNGQKIVVIDFIYDKPVTDEIYRICERHKLQSNKL